MPNVFTYVVDRDFGFAPNPFGGTCTLATCKPIIRRVARVGDWVCGMGGQRLGATGKLIFAMRVTRTLNFDEYSEDEGLQFKKPTRNGSLLTLVGDNIYSRGPAGSAWSQL